MTPAKLLLCLSSVLLLLSACGDEDGDNDSIWTGLSGLVIAIIVGVVILRAVRKK